LRKEENKFPTLVDLFEFLGAGQTIIFVERTQTAQALHQKLTSSKHKVGLLHGGGMATEKRDEVMDSFRKGETKILITTNVLARGIDVLQVTLVINYDLPIDQKGQPDFSTYLHRIGRSGRFGRPGIAINFVASPQSQQVLEGLVKFFGKPINPLPMDNLENLGEKLDAMAKAVANK